jgi:uncharacterized membrane protein
MTYTQALGINLNGQIVGAYYDPVAQKEHGFLLSKGKYTSIDYPNAEGTYAYGINDNAQIVGYWWGTGGHGYYAVKQSGY